MINIFKFPILVALGAAVACAPEPNKTAASSSAPPAPTGPVSIDIVRVVEKPLDVKLSLPGELAAYQTVAIFPRVTGFLRSVEVDRGSAVRAGALLATLDAPEFAAQRAEAQSKLQAAESQVAAARAKADADRLTFERLKAASAVPGVVAGNDVAIASKTADASASQVAAAQQGAEAARQALAAIGDLEAYLRITAPFSGVITERNAHPGALVGPSNGSAAVPLLRLVDISRLRLTVPVPEAYVTALRSGSDATFTVAAYPGRTFHGSVARIAQAVDVNTRTMPVELDVTNADGSLAPGTFCQVQWPVHRTAPSLFVPSGAVATTTDRTFVIRVRGQKTEWVDVRTGITTGPLIEVFGDLKNGDEIAGRGTDELKPGTDVRAREPKPAS